MKTKLQFVIVTLLAMLWCGTAEAVMVKLSDILPGTENTTLVANGGFETPGADFGGGHYPFPASWTRVNDMFVSPTDGSHGGPPVPSVTATGAYSAVVHVDGSPTAHLYTQGQALLPNTEYVLSAYMWNFGDAANNYPAVVDLNDAPGEAQLVLQQSDADADEGYFAFVSFNTGTTGTNPLLRVFAAPENGTGASAAFFPHGAQWDNISITLASDFAAPEFAVPEPASCGLVVLGLVGLFATSRRRRRA